MTFEERQYLKRAVSTIQTKKEFAVRRMHVITAYGTKMYLGGDSRPISEQNKWGYPGSRMRAENSYTVETE